MRRQTDRGTERHTDIQTYRNKDVRTYIDILYTDKQTDRLCKSVGRQADRCTQRRMANICIYLQYIQTDRQDKQYNISGNYPKLHEILYANL